MNYVIQIKCEKAETFVSDLREDMDKIRNSSDFVRFTIIICHH